MRLVEQGEEAGENTGLETDLFRKSAVLWCGVSDAARERRQGRARRVLMTHPSWVEASLESLIPGCKRVQICGFLALYCRAKSLILLMWSYFRCNSQPVIYMNP